jgi:hypothetical protein
MENCEKHGHRARACQSAPAVKVNFALFGLTENLCYACLSYNTETLDRSEWHIVQRYARMSA